MKRAQLFFVSCLSLAGGLAWSQDAAKPAQEQLLFVAEQLTYTPPYAIGDISVADPTIADYRVMNGRREVLLFGKTEGRTTLKIWDQKHVRVTDILIRVTTREAVKIERDLRDLLKDYPSVRIAPLGGSLVIAGEVSSERDLEAIQSIADAANVRSVVKYVPPTPVHGAPAPAPTAPGEKEKPASPSTAPEPAANGRYSSVEYEIQILEASVAFSSGTYGEGVQPSGPVLITRKAQGPFAAPIQVEIMDPILVAKLKRDKGPGPKGLRLRLTPSVPDEDGAFITRLELETNLPYESKAYDPALWRRARWQIPTVSGEPLGIAGSDLLAVMSEERSAGSIWNTLQSAAGMAGNFGAPGTGYATMYYYDPAKKTQLLMLIRARLVPRTAG